MSFNPDKPYNDLLPLPPKGELESKAVLRKAISGNKALAELKGAGALKLWSCSVDRVKNMSKKSGFLDTFLGYVQAVNISLLELIWL
jgi:hypothetical protein